MSTKFKVIQSVELLASVGINVKVFADDMKIYIRVTSNIDVRKFQTAIAGLCRQMLCIKPW